MKTTKHIINLANALVSEDLKNSNYWKEEDRTQLTKWKSEELTRI